MVEMEVEAQVILQVMEYISLIDLMVDVLIPMAPQVVVMVIPLMIHKEMALVILFLYNIGNLNKV